jgi:hypothetical protein
MIKVHISLWTFKDIASTQTLFLLFLLLLLLLLLAPSRPSPSAVKQIIGHFIRLGVATYVAADAAIWRIDSRDSASDSRVYGLVHKLAGGFCLMRYDSRLFEAVAIRYKAVNPLGSPPFAST